MKKNLQSKIKELAQQLISEKNSFNTSQIKIIVSQLLEQLTILEYLEKQIVSPDSKKQAIDSKSYREGNWFQDPKPVPPSTYNEELAEPLIEKIKDIVAQMPHESNQVDELLREILPEKKAAKNDLEDFASQYQEMPVFERKENIQKGSTLDENRTASEKSKSINDINNNGLKIGLNDRLAFIKHLFNGNADDYTRVLSQVNSLTSYTEADTFLKTNVIPEYNFWQDKEEYSERFMAILERKFN